MATKIGLWNRALTALGLRIVTAAQVTTPNDEPSRVLESVYEDALLFCLDQGHWKFASVQEAIEPTPADAPTFGFRNAFLKPFYYVRLNRIATDEHFNSPLARYEDRNWYWYADEDILYVDYVSSSNAAGWDTEMWSYTFAEYVGLYLAHVASRRLQPDKENDLAVQVERAKLNALAKDAVNGPTQFLPPGRWSYARSGVRKPRHSNSSLYGS